ncbi:MAG: LrgB family protein [Clostridia bacterium]|nr:LrgB family protein [Clostridia bacterium]
MFDILLSSSLFALVLTLVTYCIGLFLQKKLRHPLVNPLLISIVLTMLFLLLLDIDYEVYEKNSDYLNYLLTPATICLAIPLYEQFSLLKRNFKAIMAGIISGALCCLLSVYLLSLLFGLDHSTYAALMPKSVTAAIGIPIAKMFGGFESITVAAIALSGILGNIFAEPFCRIFKITIPTAKGVAIGTSSHAIGTTKALEMGDVEGAMSSLSLVVAGLLTVCLSPLFAYII